MKTNLIMLMLFAGVTMLTAQSKDYQAYVSQRMEIYSLSEAQNTGNKSVLIGATDEMLQLTMPEGTYQTAVNAFLIRTKGKNILIDTGFGKKIPDILKEFDLTPADIHYVLVTHMHGDHVGGLIKDGKPMYPNAEVHIATPEFNYWTSETEMNKQPQDKRKNFELARTIAKQYEGKIKLFEPGTLSKPKKVLFKIKSIAAYGHTPGHSMFLLGSQFLIWGDLAHAMAVQMPYPEVAVTYDSNPAQAVESRKKTLEYLIKKDIVAAGMHIPFPGVGKLTQVGPMSYKFNMLE